MTSLTLLENPSRNHSTGLRQDRQERRNREDLGGKQVNGGGAEALVRHAGQPASPHRPVASTTARGGGGRLPRSPECQEVNLHPSTPTPPHCPPIFRHHPRSHISLIFQNNTPTHLSFLYHAKDT